MLGFALEDRRGGAQIHAAVSTDGGATVCAAMRVSSIEGQPVTAPALAAAGNGRFATVSRIPAGSPAVPHTFRATSIVTGASWTYSHRELTFDPGTAAGSAPAVIASNYASAPAFMTGWISTTGQVGDVQVAPVR